MPFQEENFPLKEIPKASLIKWLLFLILIYALYDAVYIIMDNDRLILDIKDISSGLLPMIILHFDVPLLLGGLLICLLFDYRRVVQAIALTNRNQLIGLVCGVAIFLVAAYVSMPANAVSAYEIVHAMIVAGFLEELIFRGLFFRWLYAAGLEKWAYILSGIAWGAHFGIRNMVVGSTMTLWAVLPMAVFGAIVGAVIALVYKKSGSFWLIVYLHATVSLL